MAAPPAADLAEPAPAEAPVEAETPEEPGIEPAPPEPPAQAEVPADEPPPAAFEDAHREGWQDEELAEDLAATDALVSDSAAERDLAVEEADELPESAPEPEPVAEAESAPKPEPTRAPGSARRRTDPSHVTRVVDDLLEGRRDDAEGEPIEDATLVEEGPGQGPS